MNRHVIVMLKVVSIDFVCRKNSLTVTMVSIGFAVQKNSYTVISGIGSIGFPCVCLFCACWLVSLASSSCCQGLGAT